MPRKPGKNKLAYKIKNDGTTELLEPIHATSVPKKNEQTKKCVKRLDYNTRSNPKKVRATSVSKVVKQTEKCVNKPKETGTTSGRRRKTSVVAKLWEIPTLNVQKKCVRKCGKKVNFNCRNSKKCSVAASPKTVDKTDQQDSIVITVPIPDKGQKDATEGVNKLKDQNILSHAKNGNATAVFNDVDQTCEHNSTEVKVTPSNIEQKDSNNCVNKLNVKDTPLHSKKDSIPAISKDVDQTKKHKSTEVKETTPDIEKKDTNHNTSKCVNDLKAKDSPLLSKKGSAPAVPKDVGQTNEQNSTEVKVTTPDIEQKDTKNYIENCQQRCLKNCNKYQERRKKCSNCREADYQKIMETCLSSKAKWKSKHRMFLKSDDNNKGPQSSSSSKSHTDVKPEIWVKSEPVQREGDTGLLTSTHYNRLLKHLKPGLHPSKVAAPIVDTRLASLTSKAYPRVNTSISRVSKVRWPTRKPENEILESLTLKWQVFGREKSVLGLIRDQRCNEAQGYSNNELNMSTSKENSKAAGSQRNEFSMKRKRPSCTCCHTTDRLVGGTKRRRMEEREGLSHSEARPGLLNSSSAPMTSAIKRKGVHCGSDCSCREATKRQKGSEIVQETISKDMPSQAVGNSVPSTLPAPQPKQSVATQTANTEGISKSEPVPIEVHNIDNVNDLHQEGNKFTESSSELGLNVLPSVSETNIHSDMDSASECEKNTGSACDINNTPIATTEPNFSNKTSRNDVAIGDKESTLTEGENRQTKVPAPILSNTTEVLISEKEAKLSEENIMKKNAPKTSLCNTKWLLMADDVSTMTKGNSMMRNTPELHLQMLIADTNARNDALKVDKELGMTKDTKIKKKTHRQVTSVNSKKSNGSEPCTGGISCTCNDVIKSQENGVVTVYRDTVVTTDTHSLTKNTVPKLTKPNATKPKDTLPLLKETIPKLVETSTEDLLQKQEQTKANMIKDVLAVDVFPHQEETGGCLLKDDTTEKCLPKLDIVDASVKVSNVRNTDAVLLGNHTVKHNEEQDLVENNTMSCDTNIEVVSLTDKCLSPYKKAEPNMIIGNTTEDVNTTNPEDDPLEEYMNHNVPCVANHVTELQTRHSVASLQNSATISLESLGVVNGANDKCLPQQSVRNIETVSSKDQSVVTVSNNECALSQDQSVLPITNNESPLSQGQIVESVKHDECALSQDESVEPIKNLETVPQDNHSVGPVTPMPEPACVPLLRSDETVSLQDQSVAPMRNNRPVSPELQSVELLRTIENVSSEAQNVSPLTRLKCSKDISLTNGQDTIEQIQNMDADDQCVPRTTALKCSHDAMSRKESELNGSKKELSQTGRGTVTVDRETEPQNSECVPVSPVEHSSVIAMMPESLNLNQSCSTWSMKPLVLPCFKDSMMHQKYLEAKQALENTDTGLSYDSLPSSCSPVGLASVQSTPFSRHSPDQILTSFQSTPALPRRPMSRYSPTEEAFESFRRNKLARFSADLLLAGSVEDNMMLAPDSTVDISGSFSGSFSDKPGSGSEYTATPIANDRFNISDPLLVDIDADLNNDVLTTCQDLIAQLPTDMNFTFPEDDLSGEGANNLVLSQDSVNLEHNQGMFTDTGVTNGSLKENKRSWKHREEYQSKRPRSNLKTNRTPRFEKHFPTALPKVKYQKTIINEKKLYDDAERFLGDFNEKDKRSCRSRPVVQYTESMATHKASKKMELSPSTNAGVKLIEEKISTISSGIYKHNKEDTKYGSLDRNKIAELKSSIKQVEKEIKHLWIITRSPSAVSTQDEESDEEPIPTPKKRNPKNTTPKKKTTRNSNTDTKKTGIEKTDIEDRY